MSRFTFTPKVTDYIFGTRRIDAFVAKRMSWIRAWQGDVILDFQAKDRINMPGRYGPDGRGLKLIRPLLVHDFDRDGGSQKLISRLDGLLKKDSVGLVRLKQSLSAPGFVSTLVVANNRRSPFTWRDGAIFLPDFNASRAAPVNVF